jgi:hypothetical protein
MKLLRNCLPVAALATFAALGAVDASLLNLLPPDAKIISGIQVDQSKASKFGQYVLSQMGSVDDPGLRKFITETGFDPRQDLSELLIATSGTTDMQGVVVVGRGVFNPAKIINSATAAGGAVSNYNGVQLITHKDAKHEFAFGFFDAGTAVMGSSAAVKAAVDRRGAGTKLDQTTQNRVRDLAATHDAWFLSTVPVSDFFAGKMTDTNMNQAMGGNLFQAVRSASGGVKFTTTGVTIAGEAAMRSDQDATALADVIRFIAGLVQNSQDPQAKQAATLLQGLQLTAEASTLKLSLTIPEELVEKLFIPQKTTAKQRKTTASAR